MPKQNKKHYYSEYELFYQGKLIYRGSSDFFCDILNITTIAQHKDTLITKCIESHRAKGCTNDILIAITFMQLLDE